MQASLLLVEIALFLENGWQNPYLDIVELVPLRPFEPHSPFLVLEAHHLAFDLAGLGPLPAHGLVSVLRKVLPHERDHVFPGAVHRLLGLHLLDRVRLALGLVLAIRLDAVVQHSGNGLANLTYEIQIGG